MMKNLLLLAFISALFVGDALAITWGQLMYFHAGVAGKPFAVTIADDGAGTAAASTLTAPVFAEYRYTCSDSNGCDLTLGETNVVDGQYLCINNVGSNTVTVADSSGVSELSSSSFVMAQYTQLCLTYQSDRWVEKSRGGSAIVAATAAAVATTTNCSDSAGAAACGAAPAGSVVVDAAATETVVSTTAVTANSQIFLQVDSSLGTRLSVTCNTEDPDTFDARVTARTAATSFTITLDAGPTTNPLCLSYFIVN